MMTNEKQLTTKIINCIKLHLCRQDEDYDKPNYQSEVFSRYFRPNGD